jgi:hypothetical protein
MEPIRKQWNERQKLLRQLLVKPETYSEGIELFLNQHAAVHDSQLSLPAQPTFEAEIWDGLTEGAARCQPPGEDHSIVWCVWHLARVEDITLNQLVAGLPQVFIREGWQARLNTHLRDTGNAMPPEYIRQLSREVDLDALRAYRLAVGRATREVVSALHPGSRNLKIDNSRLQALLNQGDVRPQAGGLLEYWGGLTINGILLMPPTRHSLVHINETVKLKRKCLRGQA